MTTQFYTVSLCLWRTLPPFLLHIVLATFFSSEDSLFIQLWGKKTNKHISECVLLPPSYCI